jgi:polysaccharide pyruvyl transferase WcaK-like protein
MNKIKRILTINECFSDNLGDQAIAKSLESSLVKQNCTVTKADFTRTSNGIVKRESSSHKVKRHFLRRWLAQKPILIIYWIMKNYTRLKNQSNEHYDSVFIGGGQLVLNNEIFPVALFLWTNVFYKKSNIHLFAVGVGNDFGWFSKLCISTSLKRCNSISVRDELSKQNLFLKFNIESIVIPDIAYAFPIIDYAKSSKDNYDIVGITDFEVYKKYKGEVNNSNLTLDQYFHLWSSFIAEEKLEKILLTATTVKDLELSHQFYQYLNNQGVSCEIEINDKLLNLDEYLEVLNRANKVISGRMHSLILGEVTNCELVPFLISSKLISYNKERKKSNNNEKCAILDARINTILNM